MLELKFLPILLFPTLMAHCHDRFQTDGSHSSTPLHHRRAQLPVCRLIFTFLWADHVNCFHFSACSSPTGVPQFSFSCASKRITHSPQFNYSSKQGEVACQVEQHDVSFLTSVSEKIYFEVARNFIVLQPCIQQESICAAVTQTNLSMHFSEKSGTSALR